MIKNETTTASSLLSEAIAERIPVARIVERLETLLDAEARSQSGIAVPDNRVRLEASKTLLAYAVGTPVQRQEIIQRNIADTDDALLERLAASPALRKKLEFMIAQSEAIEVGPDPVDEVSTNP